MLKEAIIMIFLSCFLFVGGCSDKTNNSQVIFTQLSGKQVSLESLQGKWVVINYWASWCHPCIKEIPELNVFAKRFKKKVIVFGVNYDHVDANQLLKIIAKLKIQFPVLKIDPAAELGIKHVSGLPSTYIINPKGQVVKELQGVQTQLSLAKAIGS